MLPPNDSYAVEAGTTVGCPATDQRGETRPAGTTCDIGAVEVSPLTCAETVTVGNALNNGGGTLRWAVDRVCPYGLVVFDSTLFSTPTTITLASQIVIDKSLTISGTGAENVIISGNNANRIFDIGSGVNVTLKGMTLQDGSTNENGGAIRSANSSSSLTVENLKLIENVAGQAGGALYSEHSVTVHSSEFLTNTSSGDGGAIMLNPSTDKLLIVTDSDFIANESGEDAGAMFSSGSVSITNSLFEQNVGFWGGAIQYVGNGSGSVLNSRFYTNTAKVCCGALVTNRSLTVVDSIFSGNTTDGTEFPSNSLYGSAGAILVLSPGLAEITNSTFYSNTTVGNGGAIYSTSPLTVTSTTFDSNTVGDGDQGGAIYVDNNALTVIDSRFENNQVIGGDNGGAIRQYLSGSTGYPVYIENTLAISNAATGGADGGAFYLDGPTVITGSTFISNTADEGGAVYCCRSGDYSLEIMHSEFRANEAEEGGALYYYYSSGMTLTHSIFEENYAEEKGGAIYSYNGDYTPVLLQDVVLRNNRTNPDTSGASGGGIYVEYGPLTLENVSMDGHQAGTRTSPNQGYGGAIYHESSDYPLIANNLTISNSVVSGNGAAIYSNGALTLTNSSFYNNQGSTETNRGGGAVYVEKALTVIGSRFEDNWSGTSGGAIRQSNSTGDPVYIENTLAISNVATGSGDGGAFYLDGPTVITGSTFISNTADQGGAVYCCRSSDYSLEIMHSEFRANEAEEGGALYYYYGSGMTITHSLFEENYADDADGGAIYSYNSDSSPVLLQEVVLRNNQANPTLSYSAGGGIYAEYGPLTLENVTMDGNQSGGNGGGAIYKEDDDYPLIANNLTISNSVTSGPGGAIYSSGALTLTNSTLYDNQTTNDAGGGIYANAPAHLTNVTLYSNTAATEGGAVYVPINKTLTAVNVTMSDNAANSGGGVYVAEDSGDVGTGVLTNTLVVNSIGGDIAGDGVQAGTNNLTGTLAMGALQDNGGPTWTMLPGAAAIDAGTNDGCPATDQRGVTRPQGAACDIGAVEIADTSLSNLTISPGVLSPTFISTTLAYTALVPYNGTPLTVTPTAAVGAYTVTVQVSQNGGTATPCSGAPASCDLAVGSNVITVTVTADDGSSTDYVVTVTHASDASLGDLTVGSVQGAVALTPGFISSTLAYTAVVAHVVDSVTLTGTVIPNSGDVINTVVSQNGGTAQACAINPTNCPLAVGTNVITTTVTAADGTTKDYVVTITRASNGMLSVLDLSPATLTPGFNPATESYTATVANAVSAVAMTATAGLGDVVTVRVSQNGGTPAACNGSPISCPLAVGTNVITTTVTAADGTTKDYVVTITRATDATLSGLCTLTN